MAMDGILSNGPQKIDDPRSRDTTVF